MYVDFPLPSLEFFTHIPRLTGLQVPYDCGLFFSRPRSFPSPTSDSTAPASLFSVTGPGGSVPAYLASASSVSQEEEALYPRIAASKAIPSPLFMNIENSRRLHVSPSLPLSRKLTLLRFPQPRPPRTRLPPLTRQRRIRLPHPAQHCLRPSNRVFPPLPPLLRRPHPCHFHCLRR